MKMTYEELEKKYFELYDQKKELELDAYNQLMNLVKWILHYYLESYYNIDIEPDDEMLRNLANDLDMFARPEFKAAGNVIEKYIAERQRRHKEFDEAQKKHWDEIQGC